MKKQICSFQCPCLTAKLEKLFKENMFGSICFMSPGTIQIICDALGQGSQTQINVRAAFWIKKKPRAAYGFENVSADRNQSDWITHKSRFQE